MSAIIYKNMTVPSIIPTVGLHIANINNVRFFCNKNAQFFIITSSKKCNYFLFALKNRKL